MGMSIRKPKTAWEYGSAPWLGMGVFPFVLLGEVEESMVGAILPGDWLGGMLGQ